MDDRITLEISSSRYERQIIDHLSIDLKLVQTSKVWVAPVAYNLGNQVVERPVGLSTAVNRECLTGPTWMRIKAYRH